MSTSRSLARIGTALSLGAVLFSLAFSLAHARAQATSPALLELALPLRLSATLRRDADRGTWRSFDRVRALARAQLTIDGGGRARLTLHGEHGRTRGPVWGPTPERPSLEHVEERDRVEWAGLALLDEDRVSITFATGPTLGCRLVTVDVLPAIPALDEQPARLRLLQCTWDETPPSFERYAAGPTWTLGGAGGVQQTVDERVASPTRHVLRLPP